jgi:hypothetical protein
VLLEDPGDLADDAGVSEAEMAAIHQQLRGRAGEVGAGVRHQSIASVGPRRIPPVGDDRMALDGRVRRQAVDGR